MVISSLAVGEFRLLRSVTLLILCKAFHSTHNSEFLDDRGGFNKVSKVIIFYWSITKSMENQVIQNQSKLKANTWRWHQARENRFCVAEKVAREFLEPITYHSN